MKLFTSLLWDLEKIPQFIPKEITDQIKGKTWLKSQIIQCAAKQISSIIRGTKSKQNKRIFVHNKLLKQGKMEEAQKLWKVIEKNQPSKPKLKNVCPELDSRFIKVIWNNSTSFDGWIKISSIGFNHPIYLPFKKTSHFNKMAEKGELRPGLRLGRNQVFFNFESSEPDKRTKGKTLGLDIGIKKVFTCSDKQQGSEDKDGWNLTEIQERLCRRQKGSKNFHQTQAHRKNYINWSINQLNLKNVKELRLENIKDMRRGVRTSRWMIHWSYPLIFGKLERRCEELGVQVTYIEPAYTSQRCSQCGWVQKSNRSKETFKCRKCGFTADADLNASKNIGSNLPILNREEIGDSNRAGFYWNSPDEAPIVPHNPKNFKFFP